jgi:transmembrane sensor
MEERIKYLFRQYVENTCTREELEEFFAYAQEAKNDEQLRNLIKKVYETIRENSSLTYVDETGNLVLTKPDWLVQPVSPKKSFRKKLAIAVAIIGCIIIAETAWFATKSFKHKKEISETVSFKKKITERSEYKYLLLPDSTQVWLNAVSSLEFPDHFEENKREVFLSGEAYFDVKHAEKTPFIIHTGNISTTVLGTAFNIKAYPDRKTIIVAVSRGKVKVSRGDELVATLTKGQQVKVSNKNNEIATKNISETQVAAWQQGNMVYDDESISDIIADLERMYNVNIRLTNENIRNLKVRTSFQREDGIEHALQILCILTDTKLEQSAGIYILQ